MRGKKAKIIRRAAKTLCPPDLPELKYKHKMTPMRIFIDPLRVDKFEGVRYFHGSPYIIVNYPQRSLDMCVRRVYRDLKKHVKAHGWNLSPEAYPQESPA